MRLDFGDVTIDLDRRQLTRGAGEVHLSTKAFSLLELLVRRRPNAVRRADLIDHVWPDTFVSPSNLATLAQEIREALGDDARRPRFLKTIFGFGYAFIAEEQGGPARFRLVIGSREIELSSAETILGRRTTLLASDPAISRDHARIVIDGHRVTVEDLGSKNGTFVRGRRIAAPAELVDGDIIAIGSARVVFRAATSSDTTITCAGGDAAAP